jgi:hypothetical protein
MIIKVLLISGIIGVVILALRGGSVGSSLAARRLGGLAFVVVAGSSIVFPDLVTWLANQLNVGRGTDLVLYVSVVAFLYVTIGLYQKIHRLESHLTELTRELALLTSEPAEGPEWTERPAPTDPARSVVD